MPRAMPLIADTTAMTNASKNEIAPSSALSKPLHRYPQGRNT